MQPWENSDDKWFYLKVHLELADLGVEGEGVKEHGADESYVGRLAGERERVRGFLYQTASETVDRE